MSYHAYTNYHDYTHGFADGERIQRMRDSVVIDVTRRESRERLAKIADMRGTIAALQQSLDEATARIDAGTKPGLIIPGTDYAVGDTVELNSDPYRRYQVLDYNNPPYKDCVQLKGQYGAFWDASPSSFRRVR